MDIFDIVLCLCIRKTVFTCHQERIMTIHLSTADKLINQFDKALRTLTPGTQAIGRPSPANKVVAQQELENKERRQSAGLMRVNHAGEVCAQALYQGQALTAKLPNVRAEMEQAADEETDHLAWCEQRLHQLQSHTSVFNPVWYGLSFSIGASAGLLSDRISLGFVAATEEQVCNHLRDHLAELPPHDIASRTILETMLEDEEKHGHNALRAGGLEFPKWVKKAMRTVSRVMTSLSYRV